MENLTIEHIIPFVEAHRYTGYFLLFIAMVLEGEVFLIIAAMLAHLGAFDIGDVVMISIAGIILGNMLWYYLGYKLSCKSYAKNIIIRAEKTVTYFLPHFREKPFKSIFFSKFIFGANRATVLVSGALRVHFPLFMKAEVLASMVWVALYATVGYFFGYAAIQMTHNAARFALLIVVFVVGFILLKKVFAHYYVRREHEKDNEDSNPQR